MERNLLDREVRNTLKSLTTNSQLSTPQKSNMIWKNNTDLDAPYIGGNFNFLYNPNSDEALITFATKISYKSAFTPEQKANFISNLKKAVEAWNEAALIEVVNQKDNLKPFKIKLKFQLQIVTNEDNANKITNVYAGGHREKVMRKLNVNIDSPWETLAHELGHIWGYEDEYDAKGVSGWFQKRLPTGHVGPGSPLLKDKLSLMNEGSEFRTRYFAHFGRELLGAFKHILVYQKQILDKKRNRLAIAIIGRIKLLKRDLWGNPPYTTNQSPSNPVITPIQIAWQSRNRELQDLEFEHEIFPPDERIIIKSTNTAPYPWICKIRVKYSDPKTKESGWSEGTGILIGSCFVLTNAHVLLGVGKPSSHTQFEKIEVSPGQNGNTPFGIYESSKFQVHPNYGKEKPTTKLDSNTVNSIWDYGLIKLNENIGLKGFKMLPNVKLLYWGHYGNASLVRLNSDLVYEQEGRISGFPARKNEIHEHNGTLRKVRNIPDKFSNRLIAYKIDTEPSQSGSPIWMYATNKNCKIPILVGLHTLGSNSANIGIRITFEVLGEIDKMKIKLKQ